MSNWEAKLEQAKRLLDKGLMTQSKYDQIQDQAYRAMGLLDAAHLPSASNPRVPNQIGSYKILSSISKGGMGHVYRGRHTIESTAQSQGGDVAIKRLHAQYADDPAFRSRFQREAFEKQLLKAFAFENPPKTARK